MTNGGQVLVAACSLEIAARMGLHDAFVDLSASGFEVDFRAHHLHDVVQRQAGPDVDHQGKLYEVFHLGTILAVCNLVEIFDVPRFPGKFK